MNTEVLRNSFAGSLAATSRAEVNLREGDILIELNDMPRPAELILRGASPARGWAVVANVPSSFGKEMENAGWTLFFMAGDNEATALGFDQATALRIALTRVTRQAAAQKCNALQITRLTRSTFLGLARVSISAHFRHLQKGDTLWRAETAT